MSVRSATRVPSRGTHAKRESSMSKVSLYIPSGPKNLYRAELAKVMGNNMLGCSIARLQTPIKKTLFLCFTNRSGSNHLSDLLESTGKLVSAGEVFVPKSIARHKEVSKRASLQGLLQHIAQKWTRDGVFFAKIGWAQLLLLSELGYIGTVFPDPHFIHIERYDILNQAISFSIALQDGAWTSQHKSGQTGATLEFDRDKIQNLMGALMKANKGFREFLSLNEMPWKHLFYEELRDDSEAQVQRLGRWLDRRGFGVGMLQVDKSKLRLEKQSSNIKREWREKFLQP